MKKDNLGTVKFYLMNKKVYELISEAGWYPNRSIDISYIEEDFIREGYDLPNELIKSLLREFWNIRIQFKSLDGQFNDIRLNTDYGKEAIEPEKMKNLNKIAKETLVPVGTTNFNSAVLLISYTGKMIMLAETGLYLLGNNFEEGITALIEQSSVKQIGSPAN